MHASSQYITWCQKWRTSMDELQSPTRMTWPGNVEENFRTWFQKFELYLVTSGKTLKPDNVKCALFLHTACEKAIEVYSALVFTEAEEGKYNALVHKFKEFVEGKKDLVHECYVFNNRNQKEGGIFLSFLTNITSQAGKCGFDHLNDSIIRERIISDI